MMAVELEGRVLDVEVELNNNKEDYNMEAAVLEIPVEERILNEDGEYDVAELVSTGPRGVTNQGMIPSLKKYIKKDEKDKIIVLKKCFPEVVESSLKYLGKKEQKKFYAMIN